MRENATVHDVSFSLNAGEVLAVVGESGCGKSVLCKSIMKLLPENAKIKNGKILVNGEEIAGYGERRMRELRGKLFSMVFQNPMTSLNPTMTVGDAGLQRQCGRIRKTWEKKKWNRE